MAVSSSLPLILMFIVTNIVNKTKCIKQSLKFFISLYGVTVKMQTKECFPLPTVKW